VKETFRLPNPFAASLPKKLFEDNVSVCAMASVDESTKQAVKIKRLILIRRALYRALG
jgi:hypothetical protein